MASPFRPAAPSIAAALVFAGAAAAWTVAGELLPGGRWLAVHLLTLGVLTTLILVLSEHFSRTLTRTPGERAGWWAPLTSVAIVVTLVGVAADLRPALALGATTLTGIVTAAWWRLRTMRRRALGARFVWVVRSYERAHGAFIHGATLGVLIGTGVLTGAWWGTGRLAHLHINVLGWGGVTLLATLVFFGPSMARTRIVPGADARAARALRHGATSLNLGVVALLLSAVPGAAGELLRIAAGLGIAGFAVAVGVVCWPVAVATRAAPATVARPAVLAVVAWFPALVAIDAVVVTFGAWRWLDALGLAVLVAVLGQAVVTTLTYLAPMLRGGTPAGRELVRARLERFGVTRVAAFNLGAAAWVAGVAADLAPARAGGVTLVLASVAVTLVTAVRPLPTAVATVVGDGEVTLPTFDRASGRGRTHG